MIYNWLDKIRKMGLEQSFLISQMSVYGETSMEKEIQNRENKGYKRLWKILYLIFDYPHKHYTFKHFEV